MSIAFLQSPILSVIGLALLALPLLYLALSLLAKKEQAMLGGIIGSIAKIVDGINEKVGRTVAWLALLMVLVQTIVVLQRYVFGVNFIWLQESITYMHALLFLLAAGFTLLHGGHVRVDIYYREASPKRKAWTDFLGTYLFLIPVMAMIWTMALPYVDLSWRIQEGSTETSGIQGVYLLKTAILGFTFLLLLQGFSLAARSAFILTGKSVDEADDDAHQPAL